MNLIESIAEGIANMEGFFTPGNIAARQNNPGNLRSWGSMPIVNGYAAFPTADAGWQALYAQIEKNINRGLTLEEFFGGKPGVYGGYSPAGDGSNKPSRYAEYVSKVAGIPSNVPLSSLGGAANPTLPRRGPNYRRRGWI